jgi:hypothetical protein
MDISLDNELNLRMVHHIDISCVRGQNYDSTFFGKKLEKAELLVWKQQ